MLLTPGALRPLSPNSTGRRTPSPMSENMMDHNMAGTAREPEPPEKWQSQLFIEGLLDVVACTGRGTATVVCHAAYPVKEAVFTTIDNFQMCLHPHLAKKVVAHNQVPTFMVGNPAVRSCYYD
mmetsp:Transcript_118057/g.229535  ORF Transcript_118057/g.229535 Transcript_118057/m.229535 type:complete len:123 (-) Transcript_118057:79-447(-)